MTQALRSLCLLTPAQSHALVPAKPELLSLSRRQGGGETAGKQLTHLRKLPGKVG